MVSKAVGMGINVQINRTRLVRMGRQCGGQAVWGQAVLGAAVALPLPGLPEAW